MSIPYKIGQGSVFSIAAKPAGNTAPTYTVLTGVKTYKSGSVKTAQVETSNFGSGGMREYIGGMRDANDTTFGGIWDAGQSVDALLVGFQDSNTRVLFKAEIPNSSANVATTIYEGNISAYDTDLDFENVGSFTVSIKPSKITRS